MDKPLMSVAWENIRDTGDWMSTQSTETWKDNFEQQGYLMVEGLVDEQEINNYRELYENLMSGKVDASAHRHDLGNHADQVKSGTENIMQIMWPSVYVENLQQGPIHQRARAVARLLLGEDMDFDFDMLIAKAAHTDTITPWHQDESYWPDMPDKRALSCWVPMEDAVLDNGCMWFIPGSHKELRSSRPARPGCHVLTCDGSEEEGVACPIKAGSATFHHGRTCHYTRGNTTDKPRRAFITNLRPADMVAWEREKGYDAGKKGLTDMLAKTKTHVSNTL